MNFSLSLEQWIALYWAICILFYLIFNKQKNDIMMLFLCVFIPFFVFRIILEKAIHKSKNKD